MLKAGMTFYCNTKMANILECELTVFANMLEMLNIYEVRKEIKVEFQSFFVNYIASYSENRNVVLNMANFYLGNIDLSGAYLGNTVLVGADIARADIAGADMTRADLTGANLKGANLTSANLAGANLEEVNLEGANLEGTILHRNNL